MKVSRRLKWALAVGLATAIAVALAGYRFLYVPYSWVHGHGQPAYVGALDQWLWEYRKESGDYPHTAAEAVEKAGPKALATGMFRLSLMKDGRILVEGPKGEIELEYSYVSPDRAPVTSWKE